MALSFGQRRGQQRFVEWVTGLALNVEEHTITQSLIGLDRVPDWKALESFAEYGSWNLRLLQAGVAWAVDRIPHRRWHGYHVWAGDDTKVHRSGKHVWGTCTFHEYTARCPNRASTVRDHNWVVLGAVLPRPDEPALFLPVAGRLYFRQSHLPSTGETFHTKCELLVDLAQQQAHVLPGPHLVVFDVEDVEGVLHRYQGAEVVSLVIRQVGVQAQGLGVVEAVLRLRLLPLLPVTVSSQQFRELFAVLEQLPRELGHVCEVEDAAAQEFSLRTLGFRQVCTELRRIGDPRLDLLPQPDPDAGKHRFDGRDPRPRLCLQFPLHRQRPGSLISHSLACSTSIMSAAQRRMSACRFISMSSRSSSS